MHGETPRDPGWRHAVKSHYLEMTVYMPQPGVTGRPLRLVQPLGSSATEDPVSPITHREMCHMAVVSSQMHPHR